MRQVKITACPKRGGNIDSGIFPLAYLSVFLVAHIRSLLSQCGNVSLGLTP